MAFEWLFPEGTSEEIVTQSAGIGPVYLNDGFQLEWTPKDLRVTILLACDEVDGTYFIGNRSYDASPGFWRLTDRPVYNESPNCHFAYDGSDGNAKLFKYMNTSNPDGSTTWSASSSTTVASTSTATSISSTTTSNTFTSSAQTRPTGTAVRSTTRSDIPTATGTSSTSSAIAAPSSHPNTTAIGVGVGIAVALIIAIVTGLLLFRRRRRRTASTGPVTEYQEKAYTAASPVELASDRAYELDGENQKLEMESQDKRRIKVAELG